jgi:hypothetical protein
MRFKQLDKPCPKCGEALRETNGERHCRNGCEIYTATVQGVAFSVQRVGLRDETLTRVAAGGLRREPTNKE